MDFEVLSWNPAKDFYKRHGAVDITESDAWHFFRMNREALEALDSIKKQLGSRLECFNHPI